MCPLRLHDFLILFTGNASIQHRPSSTLYNTSLSLRKRLKTYESATGDNTKSAGTLILRYSIHQHYYPRSLYTRRRIRQKFTKWILKGLAKFGTRQTRRGSGRRIQRTIHIKRYVPTAVQLPSSYFTGIRLLTRAPIRFNNRIRSTRPKCPNIEKNLQDIIVHQTFPATKSKKRIHQRNSLNRQLEFCEEKFHWIYSGKK